MDAEHLDRITEAYRESQMVFAALRLGLFEHLAGRRATLTRIAGGLETDPRATRILCDALVSLELLEKEGDRYSLTEVAAAVLVVGSPDSKAQRYLLGARQYDRWGRLADIVKHGRQPVLADAEEEEEAPHAFAAAMADVGRASVARLLKQVDFSNVGRLLDLGGGPGVYAIAIAEAHPRLEAVVFDRPDTIEVARRNIQAAGLESRVRTLSGNAFLDDLGGPYDFVLTSNFLHMFAAAEVRRLLSRCAAVLAPGGRLCIKDFVLDEGRTSPTGVALFAVNMLISTEAGDCFTAREIASWLDEAGLDMESRIDLTEQSAAILARRRDRRPGRRE